MISQSDDTFGHCGCAKPEYVRTFGEAGPEEAIVQQLVAQIPLGHNVCILDSVKAPADRTPKRPFNTAGVATFWFIGIDSDDCTWHGKAVADIDRTLPAPQSDVSNCPEDQESAI